MIYSIPTITNTVRSRTQWVRPVAHYMDCAADHLTILVLAAVPRNGRAIMPRVAVPMLGVFDWYVSCVDRRCSEKCCEFYHLSISILLTSTTASTRPQGVEESFVW